MADFKKLIIHIIKYLQREETPEQRKELYQWYNDMDHPIDLDNASFEQLGQDTKRRIARTIQQTPVLGRRAYWIWGGVAASFLLILGTFLWYTRLNDRPARLDELAKVSPHKETAILYLPNGKAVRVDEIPLSQEIALGDIIVSKNAKGEISYRNKVSGEDIHLTYTLQTPRASTSEIILSDGTKVLLNASSQLKYPASFATGDREVVLEGEGYFQVSKKSDHSKFIVKAGSQRIEVLGTKFNVKARPEDISNTTTLQEGVVHVGAEGDRKNGVLLRPGLQSVYQGHHFTTKKADLESVLGWTKGVFYFNGDNTEEVLKEIEKWYDIDIVYAKNVERKSIEYEGIIPNNLSLDKLVRLLTYAEFKVESRINKQNRIKLIIN